MIISRFRPLVLGATALTIGTAVHGMEPAPSGLIFELSEILTEPAGAYEAAVRTVRLRYVAPELSDTSLYGFARIEGDFMHFCQTDGLAFVAKSAPNTAHIVVSLSSAAFPFGESAPNVVQYFDQFQIEEDRCVWEGL